MTTKDRVSRSHRSAIKHALRAEVASIFRDADYWARAEEANNSETTEDREYVRASADTYRRLKAALEPVVAELQAEAES